MRSTVVFLSMSCARRRPVPLSDWRRLVVWDHWESGALPVSVPRQPVSVLQCVVWSQFEFILRCTIKYADGSEHSAIWLPNDKSDVFSFAARFVVSNWEFVISPPSGCVTPGGKTIYLEQKWDRKINHNGGKMAGDGEEKEVKSYCGQISILYLTNYYSAEGSGQMDTEPS